MSELTDLSGKETGVDKATEMRTVKTIFMKKWQLLAKIMELVLSVLCIALVWEPAKRGNLVMIHLDHFALIFTTFIGYSLVTLIFLVARVIGDKIPYRTGFIFSLIATCLFFPSGILLAIDRKKIYFHDDVFYEPRPYILNLLAASSALSFFTSLIFAVEAVHIWKYREDF